MMIKLDIAKAFDKLSWQFKEKMLEAYGFCQGWIEWVMNLVTTPFFSILLNCSHTYCFQVSKGIRQGDPLSLVLFVLMAEGLSRLIKSLFENGELRGIKIHEGMDAQTHQQIFDHTMLMGHPSVQEVRGFKKCLTIFSRESGLAVNPNKSQIFFMNTDRIT